MTLYLDASVLVPMQIEEGTSARIEAWQAAVSDPFAISDLSAGEFASATSRLVRMGQLSGEQAAAILARFDQWRDGFERIEHVGSDIRRAGNLVREPTPKLLMPDAIHLATCARTGMALVTLDRELAPHAARLGIACIVPG